MAGFGGAVKLTGESEYRKALKNITQNLKEVASEMKLVSAQYSKNDTSTEALSAKSDVLSKKLEQQKDKVETLKKQYADMSEEYDENTQKHSALTKQYAEESNKLANLEKTLGTASDEYKEQADVVADLQAEVEKSTKAQEFNTKAMSDMRIQLNNAESDVTKTSKELEALAQQMDASANSTEGLGEGLDGVGEHAEKATGGVSTFQVALGNLVANVIGNAVEKMKDLVASTIDVGASFDSAMANVGAISGATGGELDQLREKAKKMGEVTKFSASDSADAMSYMAMAGWKTKDMLDGIDGIMNLASASGADLATTSDIVTDALTGFGKSAEDAGRLADIMASASSNANTNVELMGETFKYVTPVAGAMGYSMEDTALAIGLMANAGVKGTQAGTSLKSIITRLATDAGASSKSLGALGTLTESLGVEFYKADGTTRAFADVLKDARKAWAGLSEEQQASYGKTIAGQEALSGWLAIMNSADADFNKLADSINNSTGSAEKMAKVMNDNLGGDIVLMKSHLEGVQIAIYEKFEPALRKGVEVLNDLLNVVQFVVDHSTEFTTAIIAMASAVGTYVAYTTALKVMRDGWASLTIVTKAQTLAQTALNAVMSANPIGIVIALVAGLVTAFVVLWNKSEGFREFWIGLWEKIKSVAEPVINGLVEWFSNAWDKIKSVWDGVKPYFQLIWDFIKAVFSGNVVAFFFKEFSGAWSKIKEVFAPFGNFFKGLWNNVKNTFTNLGTKIGDAIGKAVKAGINGVISQIERVINSGIDLINGAIRLINLLPGVNVGKVGNVRFPRLARGGVVDSATFAEIGEAGAEAVVPLENNTGWITKIAQQLATSLVPAIANATKSVTSANYNNNSYNDTVEAFKDALGQMKIVLDDEAMGDFVEKTVADAIYT